MKIYSKKEKESGKLRLAGGSWSINLDKVNPQEFEKIQYITESAFYEIDPATALTKGFIRSFGGETKLIVPEQHWDKKIYDNNTNTN